MITWTALITSRLAWCSRSCRESCLLCCSRCCCTRPTERGNRNTWGTACASTAPWRRAGSGPQFDLHIPRTTWPRRPRCRRPSAPPLAPRPDCSPSQPNDKAGGKGERADLDQRFLCGERQEFSFLVTSRTQTCNYAQISFLSTLIQLFISSYTSTTMETKLKTKVNGMTCSLKHTP